MNNRKHVGLPKPIGTNGSATLRPLMKQGRKEINSCGADGMVWDCDTFVNNNIYLSFILITSFGSESNAGLLDKSSNVTIDCIKLSANTKKTTTLW